MHLRHAAIEHGSRVNQWRSYAPAEKVSVALGLLVLSLLLPAWPGALLVWVAAAVLGLVIAQIPPGAYLRFLALPVGFTLLSLVGIAVELSWENGVEVTRESLARASQVFWRAGAGMSCLALLSLTTPIEELVLLLRRGGLSPLGADLLLSVHRFLWLFFESVQEMYRALGIRGGWRSWRLSLRSVGMMTSSLLVLAIDRAERCESGLRTRGGSGEIRMLTSHQAISPRRLLWASAAGFLITWISLIWN